MNENLLDLLPPAAVGKTGWPWTEAIDPAIYAARDDWPLISIVTPSYNQGQYIEETLRSVLLQNYPRLEFIVIDGGSQDQTVDLLRQYDPWIDHWESEPDRGQSHALNKGIDRCTGELFCWLCSDDVFAPEAFFHIAATFLEKEARVVAGYSLRFEGEDLHRIVARHQLGLCEELEKSLFLHWFEQPSTFFRVKHIQTLGGVKEKLHYTMDSDLFVRFLLRYGQERIELIDRPIVYYRLHDSSKTVAETTRFAEGNQQIVDSLLGRARALQGKKGTLDGLEDYELQNVDPKKMEAYYYLRRTRSLSKREIGAFFRNAGQFLMSYPGKFSRHYWREIGYLLFQTIRPLFTVANRWRSGSK